MKLLLFGKTRRLSMPLSLSGAFLMTAALAGCSGTNLPASVLGGECKVFERPQYVVKGVKEYDQNWIDGNIEAGVGACAWARPKARPASFDEPSRGSAVKVAPPLPRKPSLWARTKTKARALVHRKPPGIVTPAVAAPAPLPPALSVPARPLTPGNFDPPATPPSAPPAPARSPLDELLSPK